MKPDQLGISAKGKTARRFSANGAYETWCSRTETGPLSLSTFFEYFRLQTIRETLKNLAIALIQRGSQAALTSQNMQHGTGRRDSSAQYARPLPRLLQGHRGPEVQEKVREGRLVARLV